MIQVTVRTPYNGWICLLADSEEGMRKALLDAGWTIEQVEDIVELQECQSPHGPARWYDQGEDEG